ncbi:MAG: aminotransferase class I/II-fold pyridoxal phosphate-dependent enzyme [Actinomycetia bacterium]|nr:aminotransferase class I/II-fold pyridoxal phosphate-dependent enzyme [Actinomycetes bacterium]
MTAPLSARARALLDSPAVPEYIDTHFERSEDAWHPERNPDGYIAFCIAENKLMFDVLGPKIAQSRELDSESLGYDSMVGSSDFRQAIAAFLSRTFIGREIDAEHLAVLNGVGSVLELLFYVICDPGDGVLVPTPSYTGFWADIETRDQVQIIPVHTTSESGFRFTLAQLDETVANADRPVRAMLFTNPNNPLGQIHDDDEVREIISWAMDKGIHLVLDEIYGLSTFGDQLFRSGAGLVEEMGDLLHIVWGFSKDFSMSGLRSGVLYSENTDLLSAINGLAYWASTSRDTQSMLRQLLSDEAWVDGFLEENRRRLRASYLAVTEVLDAYGVVHVPADSGLFFVVDARPMMHDLTWESEDEVWRTLLDEHGVNITPGIECHNAEPGFMRLVFSGVSIDAAVEGAHRLGRFASDRMGQLGPTVS